MLKAYLSIQASSLSAFVITKTQKPRRRQLNAKGLDTFMSFDAPSRDMWGVEHAYRSVGSKARNSGNIMKILSTQLESGL